MPFEEDELCMEIDIDVNVDTIFHSVVCENLYEWQDTINNKMVHAHVKNFRFLFVNNSISLDITLTSYIYL